MIDRTHELPVTRRCRLLEVPRSTACYQPLPESAETLALMRRIDELHLEFPFAAAEGITYIPMRRGFVCDNVFVERLWRSVKYEEVYLYAYDSVSQAKAGLAKYFTLYNTRRPHSAFDGMTPDQAYFDGLPAIRTAA